MAAPLQFAGLASDRAFISPHLRVGLRIYPLRYRDNKFVEDRGAGVRYIDWEVAQASLLRFEWNKQMGQAAGSWTAIVKRKQHDDTLDLDRGEILDGDWVDIAVLRNGIRIPLCRGVVDGVRRQTTSSGGVTVTVWAVTGRDHGAFFEHPITWSSYWSRTVAELVSGYATHKLDGRVGGRPDELFTLLIRGWFASRVQAGGATGGQWLLPQSLADTLGQQDARLFDVLRIVAFNATPAVSGLRGAYYNEPQLWAVGEQDLHQTLSQWVNPLLNEWWYDLLPPKQFMPAHGLAKFLSTPLSNEEEALRVEEQGGRPLPQDRAGQDVTSNNEQFGTMAAIIRERPFPTSLARQDSMWFNLPTWRVPTWMVEQADIGRAGNERFTLFDLMADFSIAPQEEQRAFARPRWRESDVLRHGLRVFMESTRYFAQDAAKPGSWYKERNAWLTILSDWYAPNPYLRQGTVKIKTLLPEIRIGHRVILDGGIADQAEQYYVEGVQLEYGAPTQQSGPSGSTTLILTRGFRGTDQQLLDATLDLSNQYETVF